MNISELQSKRAQAWEAAKTFLDNHRAENGMLSAEDDATYTKMENDIVNLGKEIERAERLQKIEDTLNKPTSAPITEPISKVKDEDGKAGRASDEYKTTFWDLIRATRSHPYVQNALQIGTDSEGGYLVPDEFERTLVQALNEENVVRKYAKVIRTSNGDHQIPVVTSHGSASWINEEGSYSESDEVFGQKLLGAHKLGRLIKVSEELLNDSAFDLEAYLANEFARSIGAAEETAFITGNGTGKPIGIFDSTDGGTKTITTASATKIECDELYDLFYALKAPYRKKAVWVMNDATIKAVRKLKDGNGQYLWNPALTSGQPDTLLGRPVVTSSAAPTIAAGAITVAFGDLGYYWIADREGRSFKRLNELYAANGQIGFLGKERVDGKLIVKEAVQLLTMHA